MVERSLVTWVVLMMAVGGLYAFDSYNDAGGVTGLVVNTASGSVDCTDSDNNNQYVAGVTSSSLYDRGYAEDSCVGNDLLEYYCSEDGPSVRGVSCLRGCSAGACN